MKLKNINWDETYKLKEEQDTAELALTQFWNKQITMFLETENTLPYCIWSKWLGSFGLTQHVLK